MGIGEKKTPKPFVNACDVFVYTENLVAGTKAAQARSSQRKSTSKAKPKSEADPMPLLEQAFDMAVQEDGWARLDLMGNALYQLDPGFDQQARPFAGFEGLFRLNLAGGPTVSHFASNQL